MPPLSGRHPHAVEHATARLGALLLACALAACAGGPAQIAGEPGLLAAVKDYYDRHGLEDAGRCLAPEFGRATASQVLERTADRLVVRVGYIYSDGSAPFRGDCRGFGSRVFTAARNPDGLAGDRDDRPPAPEGHPHRAHR